MIRRPPRSTPLYSSAASDVYKRQLPDRWDEPHTDRSVENCSQQSEWKESKLILMNDVYDRVGISPDPGHWVYSDHSCHLIICHETCTQSAIAFISWTLQLPLQHVSQESVLLRAQHIARHSVWPATVIDEPSQHSLNHECPQQAVYCQKLHSQGYIAAAIVLV